MTEKELIRRALTGDKQAQKECTEKGIVLPCPFCGGEANLSCDGIREYKIKTAPHFAGFYTRWEIKCKKCGFSPDRPPTIVEYNFNRKRGELEIVGEDFRVNLLKEWNTRPAPPIGRCKDCEFYTVLGQCKVHSQEQDQYGLGTYVEMLPDDYCSYFKPKEESR